MLSRYVFQTQDSYRLQGKGGVRTIKRTGSHQLWLPGPGWIGLGGRVQGQPLLPGVCYLSTVTLPLRTGRESTGSDTRMGLNWNLQPKQSAESLKKDTDTIGRSKMWMGST